MVDAAPADASVYLDSLERQARGNAHHRVRQLVQLQLVHVLAPGAYLSLRSGVASPDYVLVLNGMGGVRRSCTTRTTSARTPF